MEIVHTSVLLQEILTLLKPEREDALMVDGTLGEGGHTQAFLEAWHGLRVIGVDADVHIQARARERLAPFGDRVCFFPGWSDTFFETYPSESKRPDLILLDLGISLFHYAHSGRGFSFKTDESLDMRLDPHFGPSAAEIVNTYPECELADLIFKFGEERYSRGIARKICEQRRLTPFRTARSLAESIFCAVPVQYRHGRIHPATRTFQALRIVVNKELDRLPRLLDLAFNTLAHDGKMAVITFHSLEDRIVKNYFRELSKHCICPRNVPICNCGGMPKAESLTRKVVEPGEDEKKRNPPSRSAKLRAVRKLLTETGGKV